MNVQYFVLATEDRPNYPAGLPMNIVSNINWTAIYYGLDTADKKLQARFIQIASEADLVVYVREKYSDEIEPLNPEQDKRAADEFAKRNAERLRRESEWAERRRT